MNDEIRQFIEENRNEELAGILVAKNGISEELISKAEEELNIVFPKEYRDFLSEYGLLMAYSLEINGINYSGPEYSVVVETLHYREMGLEQNYLVVRNGDEYVDCLNVNTGEISTWDPIDPIHIIINKSFDEFLLEYLYNEKELAEEDEDFDDDE